MEEGQEDALLQAILDFGIITKEKCRDLMVGKSRNLRNVNLILPTIKNSVEPKKWLEVMTERTLNLHFVIQNEVGGQIGIIPDFHYIPVPGIRNGKRIRHAEEKPPRHSRLEAELSKIDVEQSALLLSPMGRSRELAWTIEYKTQSGTRILIFLLTFDPYHLGQLRTDQEELSNAKAYWEKLAKDQLLITGHETPPPLFLHALTGIHEWMDALFADPLQKKEEWSRQHVPSDEKEKAALLGLDLYYSSSLVTYGWSTLEKPKGREKSRIKLQQLLSKKVILFDPIYGKSMGVSLKEQFKKPERIQLEEGEKDITAKAIWESVIMQAYSSGASDIHLEPQQEQGKKEYNLIISLRKDNNVNFFAKCPANIGENVLRFALESSGIIRSHTDRGQDGRKTWIHPKKNISIDLRISITPMKEGVMQEVVIRLLDNSRLKGGIAELGLEDEEIEIWRKALEIEESLILVSGPTGSGKSSTLFAAVCDIYNRDPNKKITSIEDPQEYTFPFRATQHQINEAVGMDFPAYIRRMMRNDIDTVLVGEIRDAETLNTALQLGLTGHQILSTIHAKSAPDTILRMMEFNPEPYIISEVVKLVVAQRLAATPCPICSRTLSHSEAEEEIQKSGGLQKVLAYSDKWKKKHTHVGDGKWKKADGCPTCRFSGVQGKTALQEFLIVHKHNKKYLKSGDVAALSASMFERGLYDLETTAWKLAWMGKIPITEAARLTNTLEEN